MAEPTANSLREEGNALYKCGNLLKACNKYQEAERLAPAESAPSRNLSSAFYELGRYKESIATATKAITLVNEENAEDMQTQLKKLEQRMAKAELHSPTASEDEQRAARRKILQEFKRYKASMFTTTEYYTVGHDRVMSMFDENIEELNPGLERVSFFFGGVGDARNVLQTFTTISEMEKKEKKERKVQQKKYHFTVNDIHKCTIARDIIVWMLLDELSGIADKESDDALMTLNTIFFIYLSTVMPSYAFRQLNKTVTKALAALEAGQQPLKWLYLHKKDIPLYKSAMRVWQEEASSIFSTKEVVRKVALKIGLQEFHNPRFLEDAEEGNCLNEKLLYMKVAVLYPSSKVLEKHDPEFLKLLKKHGSKPRTDWKVFRDHLTKHWHFNATLMDIEWYSDLPRDDFDVGFDPFNSLSHFPSRDSPTKPKNPKQLYDHFAPFLIDAANAIKRLEGRMQVEAILGDYIDIAEQLQFGLYAAEGAEKENVNTRPAEFPTVFGRIHLSNVPDYTNGHLSTFLYALPILSRTLGSVLTANCLRNSDTWPDVETYLSEYQCIANQEDLFRLTGVRIPFGGDADHPMPLVEYTYYMWGSPELCLEFNTLVSRPAFTKWFVALFFRLALPFPQDLMNRMKIIFSPLNLTILFRLIAHLATLGYPSHWLSEILQALIENRVRSKARPPRRKPVRPQDLKLDHPEKHLSTGPFTNELAVLARIFQPLLPFTLTSARVPKVIHEYTIPLPTYLNGHPQINNLVLVFLDMSIVMPLGADGREGLFTNLRLLLDPDPVEKRFQSSGFDKLRNEGLIIWTSIDFDTTKKEAKVWMDDDMASKITGKQWMMGLYRTDVWEPCFEKPEFVGKELKKGRRWME